MFTGLLEDNSNLFLGGVDDQYVKMSFVYGITGIDRDSNPSGEKFNMYIPSNNRGTVVFNDNFDITNADTQNDILTACTTIQNMVCNAKACSGGNLARPSGVTCFMSEFDTWLTSTYSETRGGLTGANLITRIKEVRAGMARSLPTPPPFLTPLPLVAVPRGHHACGRPHRGVVGGDHRRCQWRHQVHQHPHR